jgi:hypothetical protein
MSIAASNVGAYFTRVFRNEHMRRGMAGAAASLVVAAILEAAWPTA